MSIKSNVRHLHISDANGVSGEGLQIGNGSINFLEIFQVLKDVDFSWVPEVWSGHLHNGAGMYQGLKALEHFSSLI